MSNVLPQINTTDSIKEMVTKLNQIVNHLNATNEDATIEALNSALSGQLPYKLYMFNNTSEVADFTAFDENDVCEVYSTDNVQGKISLYKIVQSSNLSSTDNSILTGTSGLSALYLTTLCTESGGKIAASSVTYDNLSDSLKQILENKVDKYNSETSIRPILMKQLRSSDGDNPISDADVMEIGGSPLVIYDYTAQAIRMVSENQRGSTPTVQMVLSEPIQLTAGKKVTVTAQIAYGKESSHHMLFAIGNDQNYASPTNANAGNFEGIFCSNLCAYGGQEQTIIMEGSRKFSGTTFPSFLSGLNNSALVNGFNTYEIVIDCDAKTVTLNITNGRGDTVENQYISSLESEQLTYLLFTSTQQYADRSAYIKDVSIIVTEGITTKKMEFDSSDPNYLRYASYNQNGEIIEFDRLFTSPNGFRYMATNVTAPKYGRCALMKFNLSELSLYADGVIMLRLVTELCRKSTTPLLIAPFTNNWDSSSTFAALEPQIQEIYENHSYHTFEPDIPNAYNGHCISDEEIITGSTDISEWTSHINITEWVRQAIEDGETYLSIIVLSNTTTAGQYKFFSTSVTYDSYSNKNNWIEKFRVSLDMNLVKPQLMPSEFLGLSTRLSSHLQNKELDHPDGSVTIVKLNTDVSQGFLGASLTPVLVNKNSHPVHLMMEYLYSVMFFTRDVYGELDGYSKFPTDYLSQMTSGDYSGWYYLDLTKIYSMYGAEVPLKCEFYASSAYYNLGTSTSTIEVKQVGTRVYFSSMPRAIWGSIVFARSTEMTDAEKVPIHDKYVK